jgi:hypothetical protein
LIEYLSPRAAGYEILELDRISLPSNSEKLAMAKEHEISF